MAVSQRLQDCTDSVPGFVSRIRILHRNPHSPFVANICSDLSYMRTRRGHPLMASVTLALLIVTGSLGLSLESVATAPIRSSTRMPPDTLPKMVCRLSRWGVGACGSRIGVRGIHKTEAEGTDEGEEELGTVGVGPGIGHCQNARAYEAQLRVLSAG